MMEFKTFDTYGPPVQVMTHDTEVLTFKARLATGLLERWGMVSAKPDGEDSSGRQKLALLDPDELVDRACKASDAMYNELKKRGWIVEAPSLDEALKQAQESRKTRDTA